MIESVGDVVEQRVDGEIAAERVFLRRAEGVVAVDEQVALRGRALVLSVALGFGDAIGFRIVGQRLGRAGTC